jgi:hypothetical protein
VKNSPQVLDVCGMARILWREGENRKTTIVTTTLFHFGRIQDEEDEMNDRQREEVGIYTTSEL